MPRHTQRGDPEQLKMFMTPREIVNKYQVLDADREEHYDERGGWGTNRPETTGGNANIVVNSALRGLWKEHGRTDYKYTRYEEHGTETDEQVLSRKAEEATYDPEYYAEMRGESPSNMPRSFNPDQALGRSSAPQPRGSGTSAWDSHEMHQDSYLRRKEDEHYQAQAKTEIGPPPSLYESIQEGGVQHPVHLGTQFGSQGKPQIVGGHHRIAVALDTRPDDLIPVLHHPDIYDAKAGGLGGKGYKYR